MADDGPFSWTCDLEVNLFHAMKGHKPVGVNRHFQLMCIHEKLNNAINGKVSARCIWEHLGEMYDLQALNESEICPFPNKRADFELPNAYSNFMNDEFPRSTEATFHQNTTVSKDKEKEKESSHKESRGGKSKMPHTPQAEDSPKPREQRKRTRGQVSGTTETPPTAKRSRRT